MRINFSTPAQMQSLIDYYFYRIERLSELGEYRRASIESLANSICLERQEFLDFFNDPEYKPVIKRGLLQVENDLEKRIMCEEEIEDIMAELVNDFGWTPLDDDDRKLIALSIN